MPHWPLKAHADPVVHRQGLTSWVGVIVAWSRVVDKVVVKNRIYIKSVAKNPL